ncbi:TIGR02281 family clan AA aspartic protease, partial [Mesorhizobium sp. M7A.T.Ca.TU.009.01.1.1]
MLRKLLILAVFAGSSASIPIVYQSNPQLVENLLRSAVPGKQAVEAQPDVNLASVPNKPAAPLPMGRKVIVAADERGHFSSAFKLNGRQVDGMIDTGATLVAIN